MASRRVRAVVLSVASKPCQQKNNARSPRRHFRPLGGSCGGVEGPRQAPAAPEPARQNGGVGPGGAAVHFMPGFPVMAWPMIEWLLDQRYADLQRANAWQERSVIVMGAMEAALTPLMESIEAAHAVKVFSLPSVDHPTYGRHIELGVKGAVDAVGEAFAALLQGLRSQGAQLGPELVR